MRHLEPNRALHIVEPDLSPAIGARENETQTSLTIAFAQGGRHAAGISHRGELLVHDQHDFGSALERVQCARIGPRYVQYRVTVRLARKFEERPHATSIERSRGRAARGSEKIESE